MDESFSKTAFESDVTGRRDLQTRLAYEISRRIHEVAVREFEAIGRELQALGHSAEITSSFDPEFAAWSYVGDRRGDRDKALHLRFHYDSQASCFYD
jgi:hypothetical protein